MAKYKIELPVKNVPSDWTNYNRSVQVIDSSAPSNYSKVILSESKTTYHSERLLQEKISFKHLFNMVSG